VKLTTGNISILGGSRWFQASNNNLGSGLHLHQIYFLSDNDTLVKVTARIIQRNQFEDSKSYVPRSLNFKAHHHAKLALKLQGRLQTVG
jgi:hypothetical protein